MATKGWNYIWGESWHEYVQRSTITNDLTKAQRESSKAMIGAISEQTAAILTGVESSTHALTGEMADGFSMLGDHMSMLGGQMNMIAGKISALNASFQWGFGQMLAQMDGMNVSLQRLIEIAKTPVQTWAYNQFEIARENFRKGLYTNCLKRLDKAINGDQTSAGYEEDWRFHQMIGVIRLGFIGCEMKLIDLPRAEEAFLLAAHYAKVDEPKEAAKAFLSAGWSAFVQGKSAVALSHTEQAIALDATLAEAYFQLAKIQMAANSPAQALRVLRHAIDQIPGYVVKAAADGDFQRHQDEMNSFYSVLRKEVFGALVPTVGQTLNEASEWAQKVPEVASCEPTLERWREFLKGSWGLLDLLTYQKEGFDKDRQAVVDARARGLGRMKCEQQAKADAEKYEQQRLVSEKAARAAASAAKRESALKVFWGFMIPGSWIIGGYIGWKIPHLFFETPILQVLLGIPMVGVGAIVAQMVPYYFLEK